MTGTFKIRNIKGDITTEEHQWLWWWTICSQTGKPRENGHIPEIEPLAFLPFPATPPNQNLAWPECNASYFYANYISKSYMVFSYPFFSSLFVLSIKSVVSSYCHKLLVVVCFFTYNLMLLSCFFSKTG